eukprot:3852843-Pyramimonas_sp.AAC.1
MSASFARGRLRFADGCGYSPDEGKRIRCSIGQGVKGVGVLRCWAMRMYVGSSVRPSSGVACPLGAILGRRSQAKRSTSPSKRL